jgi:hypothetical protein
MKVGRIAQAAGVRGEVTYYGLPGAKMARADAWAGARDRQRRSVSGSFAVETMDCYYGGWTRRPGSITCALFSRLDWRRGKPLLDVRDTVRGDERAGRVVRPRSGNVEDNSAPKAAPLLNRGSWAIAAARRSGTGSTCGMGASRPRHSTSAVRSADGYAWVAAFKRPAGRTRQRRSVARLEESCPVGRRANKVRMWPEGIDLIRRDSMQPPTKR